MIKEGSKVGKDNRTKDMTWNLSQIIILPAFYHLPNEHRMLIGNLD